MSITTNIIIQNHALDGIEFKESIDLALVCAAFDQTVNLIFISDGVTNLIRNQSAAGLGDKNQVDIIKALEFYDIDNIFVEKASLIHSLVSSNNFLQNANIIESKALKELNLKADRLVVL